MMIRRFFCSALDFSFLGAGPFIALLLGVSPDHKIYIDQTVEYSLYGVVSLYLMVTFAVSLYKGKTLSCLIFRLRITQETKSNVIAWRIFCLIGIRVLLFHGFFVGLVMYDPAKITYFLLFLLLNLLFTFTNKDQRSIVDILSQCIVSSEKR